jgi:Flp pilus assembly protein TadD
MFKNRQFLPLLLLLALTGCNGVSKPKWFSRLRNQPEDRQVADDENSDEKTKLVSGTRRDPDRDADAESDSDSTPGTDSADAELAAVERHARMIREAQSALRQERIEEASRIYRDVLNEAPDHPDAHHGLAMAADLDEDWGDAEYHYKQALRIRPRDAVLLSDLGYSYILQNRFSEAARYLNQAIELQPGYERAHMNIALLDIKQGNRAAAEQRLVQRLGNSSQTAGILASLEQQAFPATVAPATTSNPAARPERSPGNTPGPATESMSLEQVQELARREREASRQQRIDRESVPALAHNPQLNAPEENPYAANPPAFTPSLSESTPPAPPRLSLAQPKAPAWPSAEPQSQIPPQPVAQPQPNAPLWTADGSQPARPVALNPPVPIRSATTGTTVGAESYGQPVGFNRNIPSRMRISESPAAPNPGSFLGNAPVLRTEGLNIGPGSLFPVGDSQPTSAFSQTTANPQRREILPAGYSLPAQMNPAPSAQGYPSVPVAPATAPVTAQYPTAWPPAAQAIPTNPVPQEPVNPALQPYRDQLRQINDQFSRQQPPPAYYPSRP